ncbi:penicillin-binding protein 1C [Shimia sp. FJ5]|uniref:penicillin-binding protein 1C n=1 Tax=Shimia sp. FJ5 TaxID=3079054 RepID=UPI00293DA5E2|nr:penicillin-binding protein 1C [Shimia sp. FJ5]MDV4144759.1 penicillin-binding protein 1C [Shimia sp. FJ5]
MIRRFAPFALVAALLFGAAGRDAIDDWIDATEMPPLLSATSAEVRDRDGALLRAYTVEDGLWRLGATPGRVDRRYLDMLIAYEDKRFYRHVGVDPIALARAAWQALLSGNVISGGSTLTMQVARLLEDGSTRRWRGKLRQMRLAMAIERRLSKDDILTLYLTHAPFGGNLEGIRAATLAWFGKEPTRLTPAEAAFLIALPQSPETRRPDRAPLAARAARNRVLTRLTGGTLDPETAKAAIRDAMPNRRRAFPALAPHLADRALADSPDALRHDLTLDATLQASLESLAADTMEKAGDRLSIALMIADHQSGEILASVGSAAYDDTRREGFVDMTRALRSPGSTLKPLVYAMGFDQGLIHPETLINDAPVRFGSYAPQNFDGAFRGELRVAEALRLSLNIPVILITDQIGPARLMSALRKTGGTPRLPTGKPGLAMALGGVGVTMEDLLRLYAMLGNGGKAVPLHWSKTLVSEPVSQVVSHSAAWQIGHILSALTPPPGAPQSGLAYKTGTSYGHRDAWAVGYDGRHVGAVWIGRPDGTPVPGAFGGEVAAPVLFEAFQRLKPALDPLGPPPPETLLLGSADLPEPLRRFQGRNAVFERSPDAPRMTFPPNGARLVGLEGGLTVKVRAGALPYTILANGRPLASDIRRREITLPFDEKGASTVTIIDAKGRADRAEIWVE